MHADDKKQQMVNKVMTVIKNVVYNIIIQVKAEKAKPKLQDILKIFKGKDKEFVANKLRLVYSKEEQGGSKGDPKYELLTSYFERLRKIF